MRKLTFLLLKGIMSLAPFGTTIPAMAETNDSAVHFYKNMTYTNEQQEYLGAIAGRAMNDREGFAIIVERI